MAPNRRVRHDHHGGGNGNHGGGGRPAAAHQNNQRNGHQGNGNGGVAIKPYKCVRPKGCLEPKRLIYKENIDNGSIEVQRVTCNNLQCDQGNYMHIECFKDWETTALSYLSSTGRARSWSDKQRLQNVWTKKGYDLAFRACECNCVNGHLRKDLDWISPKEKLDRARIQNVVVNHPPPAPPEEVAPPIQNNQPIANNQNPGVVVGAGNQQNNAAAAAAAVVAATEEKKKKTKRQRKESLPTLSLSAPVHHPNDNHSRKVTTSNTSAPIKAVCPPDTTPSTSASVSSGVGSFGSDHSESPSPASSGPWNMPESSLYRPRVNSLSSNASGGSSGAFSASSSSGSPPSPGAQFGSPIQANSILSQHIFKFQRKNSNGNAVTDRIRHNSTGSLFSRRNDFSSFSFLPKQKQNSYHIKMDDDGHGNDEMRFVVLTTLQNQRMTKVNCCCCQSNMVIYDRYPLIDGTFFIAPKEYGKESIKMMTTAPAGADGTNNIRYLTAICMHCLSGKYGGYVCRGCGKAFDGTSVILGAIYSYDIFASMACCRKRVECGNCRKVMHSDHYQFFSQGSNRVRCSFCGYADFHMAKPLESFDYIAAEQFDNILRTQKLEAKRRVIKTTSFLDA